MRHEDNTAGPQFKVSIPLWKQRRLPSCCTSSRTCSVAGSHWTTTPRHSGQVDWCADRDSASHACHWQMQWLSSRVAPRGTGASSAGMSPMKAAFGFKMRPLASAARYLAHEPFYCKGASSESLTVGSMHASSIHGVFTAYWGLARLQIEQFRRVPVSPDAR